MATSIDTATLKATFEIIPLVPDLKKSGAYWIGPCPFCGGKDRFQVKPTRDGQMWICRNCAPERYHDAISFVARRENLDQRKDFKAIIEKMGGTLEALPAAPRPAPVREPAAPPNWQEAAYRIMNICQQNLYSPLGARALAWLKGPKRRLTDSALETWNIGYSPDFWFDGLHIERGIVIPCYEGGDIWYLKIRRPAGDPKYRKVKGSKSALFGGATLARSKVAFVCEGEFDAMQLWSAVCTRAEWNQVAVITPGSATDRIDPVTWGPWLFGIDRFIAVYDHDRAGEQGTSALTATLPNVQRAALPEQVNGQPVKDVTDFVCAGGDLPAWIESQLEAQP